MPFALRCHLLSAADAMRLSPLMLYAIFYCHAGPLPRFTIFLMIFEDAAFADAACRRFRCALRRVAAAGYVYDALHSFADYEAYFSPSRSLMLRCHGHAASLLLCMPCFFATLFVAACAAYDAFISLMRRDAFAFYCHIYGAVYRAMPPRPCDASRL